MVDDGSSPLPALSYFFYLSKIYEFLDTWIVLLKGRKPIFLQVFHHIGAVLIMWALTQFRTEATWLFLSLNSFIHTLMYARYALTVVGIHPPFKSLLTTMQLVQFVVGMGLSAPYFFIECLTGPAFWALACNNTYVTILVFLFADFFKKNYLAKKPKKE